MAKRAKMKAKKKPGRPAKAARSKSRTIILGADEWAELERQAGIGSHASWADKVRAVLGLLKEVDRG